MQLADCRAIIELAKETRRAVAMGASFIGLEVAASLRARDIEVHVVAPDRRPMEQEFAISAGSSKHAWASPKTISHSPVAMRRKTKIALNR